MNQMKGDQNPSEAQTMKVSSINSQAIVIAAKRTLSDQNTNFVPRAKGAQV